MHFAIGSAIFLLSVVSTALGWVITSPRTGETLQCGHTKRITFESIETDSRVATLQVVDSLTEEPLFEKTVTHESRYVDFAVPNFERKISFVFLEVTSKVVITRTEEFSVFCPGHKRGTIN